MVVKREKTVYGTAGIGKQKWKLENENKTQSVCVGTHQDELETICLAAVAAAARFSSFFQSIFISNHRLYKPSTFTHARCIDKLTSNLL